MKPTSPMKNKLTPTKVAQAPLESRKPALKRKGKSKTKSKPNAAKRRQPHQSGGV